MQGTLHDPLARGYAIPHIASINNAHTTTEQDMDTNATRHTDANGHQIHVGDTVRFARNHAITMTVARLNDFHTGVHFTNGKWTQARNLVVVAKAEG